jgi:hypothetical protein
LIFRKKAQIASIAVCVIMVMLTIFLVSLAVMFSGNSSKAPEFFGSNLYLVQNDTFDLIPAPSAVIGEKIDPASLGVGDIVIFETDFGGKSIGEIIETGVSPPPVIADNGESNESGETVVEEPITENTVAHLRLNDELGAARIIPESAVISKAVRTSRTLGMLINFVASPTGVLVIAVIPCVCLILGEALKPLFKVRQERAQVVPVNKQDETPTFIPVAAYLSPSAPTESPKAENPPKSAVSEDTKPVTPAAALKAYKQALSLDETDEDIGTISQEPELFMSPKKPNKPIYEPDESLPKPNEFVAKTAKPAPASGNNRKKKPLSSVKLAEAIAAVNAQREQLPDDIEAEREPHELSTTEKAELINQALAKLKQNNSGG